MSHLRIGASVLGALGIFLVFVLFGISCGSSTSTDVSKSVSTTYKIAGNVWHDVNGDGDRDFPADHGVYDIHVVFVDYGTNPPTEYEDWTDIVGTYEIDGIPSGAYGRVGPTEYDTDYTNYAPTGWELTIDKNYTGKDFRGYTP